MKIINNEILVGCGVIFKEGRGKKFFLLSKNAEGNWELLKTNVRRGESSVRSIIRYTSEQGNMATRVLDEVGRATSVGTINNRSITYKYIYYLMLFKAGVEIAGLGEITWFNKEQAIKKLTLKREINMIKTANTMIKNWEKENKKK